MSRIGKKPIPIPQGVKVELENNEIKATGPKGTIAKRILPYFTISKSDGKLVVGVNQDYTDDKKVKGLYGLTRTIISNMVLGVSSGFRKTLELVGTGYKVEAKERMHWNLMWDTVIKCIFHSRKEFLQA